ncbi:MAG: ELM1/GtrOC1 family putative glycosyltransferase [Pseudomonadales bacterium]|nr:ELM1/GtrOC1 family putative glycosyltransferase [Pseudomonadales bacterium]
MNSDKKPLQVLILSDGIPGHVNQALGLSNWIANRFQVQRSTLEVKLRAKAVSRLILPWVVNCKWLARVALFLFYGLWSLPEKKPALIISMGGNTSFANILFKHYYQCPNVFLGSSRRLNSNLMSAHLSLESTGKPTNFVLNISPSTINVDDIKRQASQFIADNKLAGEKLWALIIGGDGAGYNYSPDDWKRLAAWADYTACKYNIRWLLTTSRRTGKKGEDILQSYFSPAVLAYGVWWDQQPEKKLAAMLGAAEQVFVTADSMSMINEAFASEKPVSIIDQQKNKANQRYVNALNKFETQGLCFKFYIDQQAMFIPELKEGRNITELITPLLDFLEEIIRAHFDKQKG